MLQSVCNWQLNILLTSVYFTTIFLYTVLPFKTVTCNILESKCRQKICWISVSNFVTKHDVTFGKRAIFVCVLFATPCYNIDQLLPKTEQYIQTEIRPTEYMYSGRVGYMAGDRALSAWCCGSSMQFLLVLKASSAPTSDKAFRPLSTSYFPIVWSHNDPICILRNCLVLLLLSQRLMM